MVAVVSVGCAARVGLGCIGARALAFYFFAFASNDSVRLERGAWCPLFVVVVRADGAVLSCTHIAVHRQL